MLNLQLYLIGLRANPRRDAATKPVLIILIDISTISPNIFVLGECEKKSSIVKYDEMLKHPKKCWFDLNVFDAPKKVARRSIEIDSPNGNLLRLVNFKFLPNPM